MTRWTAEMQAEATRLREDGWTYADIAAKLGYGFSTVHRYVSPLSNRLCFSCEKRILNHRTINGICVNCNSDSLSLKRLVFNHYGWTECWCCGETHFGFLTIAHLDNDGDQHRKLEKNIGGHSLYIRLIRSGFECEWRLGAECWNCNSGNCLGVPGHKKTISKHAGSNGLNRSSA